jgi:hypothetical protein
MNLPQERTMADGDDVEIGSNNQAQSTTQLVLTLGSPLTTILKCGTGGAWSSTNIAVHGMGNTGIKGEGGVGVHGRGTKVGVDGVASWKDGIGVRGQSDAQEGVVGFSSSGIGVSGHSKSDAGVLGASETGIGVRGSVDFSPFPLPAKAGVLGESSTGVGVCAHAFQDTALKARSVSGMAVHAQTDGNFAVYASAPKGFGVFGEGPYGVSGQSKSKSGIGVFGRGPEDGYAGYFEGHVLIKGNLTKTGVGCAVAVPFPDKTFRQLCSIESPESWFEDFGEARLVKGKAEVKIDPDFAKTVNLKTRYHVFVTPHSTKLSGLAVVSRRPGGFRVEDSGGGSGTFSYRIIAKRADIRVRRLERVRMPTLPGNVPSPRRRSR